MGQTVQHLQPGTLLSGGRYRILRFIGAGGFGCTYEAEFVKMRTRVAIKEFFVNAYCNRDAMGAVSVGAASQAGLVKRLEEKFQREAQRLFKLQHPYIVRVSDILEENGTSYYVMDYIDGRSLQSIVDSEGPLPQERALHYIGHVMDALEYVHGENMLHLDIKPDNIMVDAKTDRAILIDFGVSKQYDEVDGHNTSTIMGHTPGYAPPEQSGNNIRQFTPAADVYALGATLYCALTGLTPPSSTDLVSGFAHLSPLPAGTNPSLGRAIGLMMQPNAAHRPQSISAVRALLRMENGEWKIENGPAPGGTETAPLNITASDSVPAPLETVQITTPVEMPVETAITTAGRTDIAAESVMLACVYKPTKEQRFFTQSEWNAVSNQSDYIKLGVGVNYGGHKFIVAGADASSNRIEWANYENNVPDLPDIYGVSAAKRDFDGPGNTDKIINAISANGIAYPAASAARGYKAAPSGDPTKWSLPAVGQLWLIYEHKQAINDELAKYGMVIMNEIYWPSTGHWSSFAWLVSMYSGEIYSSRKLRKYRVRAVAPVR